LNGDLPDVISHPSGGTGLVGCGGVWRAGDAGLDRAWRPRMVTVQAAAGAPIVRAPMPAPNAPRCGKMRRRSRSGCGCRARSAIS
jgi:hypothetical protein